MKREGWGGRRKGAGRPKGSGKGPDPNARRNRVAVMFSDVELVLLQRAARKVKLPPSTAAYRFVMERIR